MKPKDARTSEAMSRVKQARTAPEDKVAEALRSLEVAYRRNVKNLPGRPDFANRARGWAIQVHGCFWHQHTCRRGTTPIHNRELWQAKFARNRERDAEVEAALVKAGLRVVTLWECETKDATQLKELIQERLRLPRGRM
ncbi:very short patch repair endonuclease [Brevundimonas sp. PAMC22021]|uniref:very short patch repair endonuclease n=1 Tax=Brevundimonas sp. PAMC22021 TaxID=2861285 RepID=UPI001C63421E|nr:very short patch repair endonuclease [Brevundimonas sp. PAMC22021]QYF87197.1 very short patch repair endonuclease [Brevundimonas sp. PAMC22021]